MNKDAIKTFINVATKNLESALNLIEQMPATNDPEEIKKIENFKIELNDMQTTLNRTAIRKFITVLGKKELED